MNDTDIKIIVYSPI